MAENIGNHQLTAKVERPVDGDTVRVTVNGLSESVRIQALDTEESKAGGDKPVTPWGKKTAEHAATLFTPGREIILDFDTPKTDAPPDTALSRFRDNYGRLLALIFIDDLDFQEHMISLGYSPYFPKYGNVHTEALHRRYLAAERKAQAQGLGVWNQVEVNGSVMRDYPALAAWWALRAAIIDDYRRARAEGTEILNPRIDFETITQWAEEGRQATVFTEFRTYRRLSSRKAVIDIGSQTQPFSIFIPDIETAKAQELIELLQTRYIAGGTEGGRTVTEPRRGYGYVRGHLKLFNERPEIVVDGPEDVFDHPL
jgi:micrococcal nuclease